MAAPLVALLAILQFDSVPARRPLMAIGQTIGVNTYFESVPIAFFGSWSWEYFGETYRPSLNDWQRFGCFHKRGAAAATLRLHSNRRATSPLL